MINVEDEINDLLADDLPMNDEANNDAKNDGPEAVSKENDNTEALAELDDVPTATKKRKSANRGPKLDVKRLLSARGIPAIPGYFEDVKLKGKGHEVEDLNLVMSNFEHWAHRLYPKLTFDDCLEKIETLGHKKEIQTCLKKMRMGMPLMDDENQSTVITRDGAISDKSDAEDGLGVDIDLPDSMADVFASVPSLASQPPPTPPTSAQEDTSSFLEESGQTVDDVTSQLPGSDDTTLPAIAVSVEDTIVESV